MVTSLSNFCLSIICTIIIVIIIEMIMPEGKNKKYTMFVCGLVVTLVLIEPTLNLFKINLDEIFNENEFEYNEYKVDESVYDDTLKKSYEKILVDDVINRLKENGYNVSNVKVEYDEITFEPTRIYMNLESENGYVQPVKIEVNNSNNYKNEIEINKIKNIITECYGIEKENIIID